MFDRVDSFLRDISELQTEDDLAGALGDFAADMGFRYFALTHHVDVRSTNSAIRIHNYPNGWADWFDEQGLGCVDPVHRASHRTCVGFAWSSLSEFICLTPRDVAVLNAARRQGIGEGFTVPAHVPGEAHGSVSFAHEPGVTLDCGKFILLQLAGAFAFDAARRIRLTQEEPTTVQLLTQRQREVVMWAARGKSDWEISRILDVSQATVTNHLKQACERYGVGKRTLLTIHALFDGSINFVDVLEP